jgi:hypothetical protein
MRIYRVNDQSFNLNCIVCLEIPYLTGDDAKVELKLSCYLKFGHPQHLMTTSFVQRVQVIAQAFQNGALIKNKKTNISIN